MNYFNESLNYFNSERYQGTWYEIAKYPFKWEIGCHGSTAEYEMSGNELLITNSCKINNKQFIRKGRGIMIEDFKFKIIFDDGLPNDGVGDYWIEYTDYDNYSIVGSPSRKYLWILSRRQIITQDEYNFLLNIVRKRGYPTDKLVVNKI